ncbi:MAG: radical SAM protein [Clostridia bacterium]|nr:radical SAM protein [Clostridia bacterium]
MKKALIVFPPQWCPSNPYPSVPTLLGCLKSAGIPAEGLDLNIRFYNSILSSSFVSESYKKACKKGVMGLPDKRRADELCNKIESTLEVFRNEELFYNPDLLYKAKSDLNETLEVISAPYAPSKLMISDYFHGVNLYDIDMIVHESKNEQNNIFYGFLKDEAKKIAECDSDYILVSAADITQILPVFTLCGFLKEFCTKPVCIGGNIITKLKNGFISQSIIFEKYADYIACGAGEYATIALANYINGDINIDNVPGLVYRNKAGKTICNPENSSGFVKPVLPDYSFFDFKEYLSPFPDCSLQLSLGCYWGKCAFCDVSYNREKYIAKPIDAAIEEIENLISQGIRHIHLGDSSVSPAYFDKLCDAIIKRNLSIFLFAFARLEKAFTPELFAKMYRAGVRLIFWGYESHSGRIMSMINKGIDIDSRLEILRYSAEAGIWNHVSFMMGFPGETRSEALLTLKAIKENREIIDSCFLARFSFKTNAKIHEDIKKYNLSAVNSKGEFSTECFYNSEGMSKDEITKLSVDFRKTYIKENIDTLWPMVCDDLEHLLFYISHYGRQGVRDLRLQNTSSTLKIYQKFLP